MPSNDDPVVAPDSLLTPPVLSGDERKALKVGSAVVKQSEVLSKEDYTIA